MGGNAGSPTRSMFAGGFTGPSPGNFWRDTIDFVNTPTLGNAQDFGDLTQGIRYGRQLVQMQLEC